MFYNMNNPILESQNTIWGIWICVFQGKPKLLKNVVDEGQICVKICPASIVVLLVDPSLRTVDLSICQALKH